MRESEMTTVRLPISFALALCTSAALFGLLHVLITVDRVRVWVETVPDVEFVGVIRTVCVSPAKPRIKPVLVKAKPPPAAPPIAIEPQFFGFVGGTNEMTLFDAGSLEQFLYSALE